MNCVEIALYIFSLIGSGVGFMTQMVTSGYWTTAFSHDVFYFSVNLATYFLALGLGSLFSNRFEKPSLRQLAYVIVALNLVCGITIPFLRESIKHFGNNILFPQLVVMCAGLLNGMVIPLTLKMGENYRRMSLGLLFFIDYSAATIFALLFTFVFLIPLGYSRTSLLLSLTATGLAALLLLFQKQFTRKDILAFSIVLSVPVGGFFYSGAHVAPKMDRSGIAKITYSEQSHYQKIILTEEEQQDFGDGLGVEHVLYLDGFVQFSSDSEQNYHLCLADIPLLAATHQKRHPSRVLILGGGDGLAARNFLKNPSIKKVTLVELDPSMIRLATHHSILRKYNQDSLRNTRVEVVVADAFRWVNENRKQLRGEFDLIIVDFPAPKNLTLARLFSAEFYRAAFEMLSPGGFISIQAGPSFSFDDPKGMTLSKVTTSILKTIESLGYFAFPYIVTQDNEAFVLATADGTFEMDQFSRKTGIYSKGTMALFCKYDASWVRPEVEINTLNTLKLSTYMMDWFKRAGDKFFYYRGNSLVFLPE